VSTNNPNGDKIIGFVLTTASATRILFYNSTFNNTGSSTTETFPNDMIFDCKPALNGGMWLSFLESYKAATGANEYFQYYWYGGAGKEHTHASTVSLGTSGTGTRTTYTNVITGTGFSTTSSDSNYITPGMFVYLTYSGSDYYIGMIKSITGTTTITLEKDIIRSAYQTTIQGVLALTTDATIKFKNVRPFIHQHGRGLITRASGATAVNSGSLGTEGEGHFRAADLGGITTNIYWGLYRNNDNQWIGDIITADSNTGLTLSTNYHDNTSTTILNADEYTAWPYQSVPSATVSNADSNKFAGIFTATYANYQWYANGGNVKDNARIVFSATHNSEAVDLSLDSADSIIIPTDEIRGLASSSAGLLIFGDKQTFILRGNSRYNFSLEILYPEGCLSSMSIVEYGGGVFWASRNGILYYDGASIRNLTKDTLGVYYTDSIRGFNINTNRVYSFFHKDYLFIHFNSFDSVFKPYKYEPVYANTIEDTEAIEDFKIDDWDPDFIIDGFLTTENIPIYWDPIELYGSTAATSSKIVGVWQGAGATPGYSFPQAVLNSTTSVSGLSYTDGSGNTIDTNDIAVGDHVLGANIPSGTTVSAKPTDSTITLSAAATASTTQTIQIVTGAPTYVWGAAGTQYVWGPIQTTEGITFAIYLPTNAFTTLSNFDFRGATKIDATSGLKALMGVNIIKPEFTVTNKSLTSNVATLTVSVVGIPDGSTITVSGIDDTFNGNYTVSSVSGNTITYPKTASNVTSTATTGTVTVTSGTYPRIVDVDSILETSNNQSTSIDDALIENNGKEDITYVKGPDFYLQTKHFTVGDPIIKKWFRQVMLNLYLLDGAIRMDVVDMEDNDRIDILKRRHKNWEVFEEAGYTWDEFEAIILPRRLAPNKSTWNNTQALGLSWYNISDSEFTRRKKKLSWRYPSLGFRLYQMNEYRPANYQDAQRPHTIMLDSWNIGFKPMRQSRV
jgi:hypothetical protein